jgi:DNA-binding MarR family transcriptional regulator
MSSDPRTTPSERRSRRGLAADGAAAEAAAGSQPAVTAQAAAASGVTAALPAADLAAAADQLLALLPALVAALRDSGPHAAAQQRLPGTRLTPRQMTALVQLQLGGRQSMSAFAAGMGVSRATATEMVERLEERGLAVREHDDADRRVIVVRLSDAAAAEASAVVGRRRQDVAEALSSFPGTPPAEFVAFVHRLTGLLGRD